MPYLHLIKELRYKCTLIKSLQPNYLTDFYFVQIASQKTEKT